VENKVKYSLDETISKMKIFQNADPFTSYCDSLELIKQLH